MLAALLLSAAGALARQGAPAPQRDASALDAPAASERAVAAPVIAAPREDPFARELRVRSAAAHPARAEWLAPALDPSAPWTAAVDALEALARAQRATPELDLAPWLPQVRTLAGAPDSFGRTLAGASDPNGRTLAGATDPPERTLAGATLAGASDSDTRALAAAPHPNVRAAAWRVLARAPAPAAPPPAASAPGASFEEPRRGGALPWEARLERGRALARAGCDAAVLAELCADPDVRVADAALAEALQASERDEARLAALWLAAFDAARWREDERATRLLQMLELAPRGAALARRVADLSTERAADDPVWRSFRALFLAALARQGGALDANDLARLTEGWELAWRRHTGARELLSRAARTLGPRLGEPLARRAASAREAESAEPCFAGAVQALEGNALLRLVAPAVLAKPAIAEPLFDNLRGRAEAWDPEALAPWLALSVAPSQRAHTVLIVAETFRQDHGAGSAQILVRALQDPDPAVAAEAFQGLAGAADPRPWMDALHAEWTRRPAAWREERLADLSREIPWTPFRTDLIELAAQSRSASAKAAELLAPFRGDQEVADALREWLEQDLARLRAMPARQDGAPSEPAVLASALSLVRALSLVAGEQALPSLLLALESSRGRSLELGKGCIFLLGRSVAGRRELAGWLEPGVASRLRAEAALALAPHPGREPAIRLLLDGYPHYDEELRMRALRAFASADDAASERTLLAVARAADSGAAEILTAVDCLGARARREPRLAQELLAWLDEPALDTELRTLAIAELVELGTPDVLARLRERLTRHVAPEAAGDSRADQDSAFERESLITALARADAIAGLPDALAFEGPLARAAADFRSRCRGELRAEAEFAARPELTLVAALVRAGALTRALEAAPGWRGLDARFLLECAARASPGERGLPPEQRVRAAEELALAALIALDGECAADDTPRTTFEARRLALEAARARGDAAALAARGAALLHDVRTGELAYASFARAWGDFDPRREIDGLGQLAAEVHLARARVELAQGRRDAAREELARARDAAGASQAARAAVAAFERDLDERR